MSIHGQIQLIPYHSSTGLPLVSTTARFSTYNGYLTCCSAPTQSTSFGQYDNLSPSQCVILIHHHYNHVHMKRLNKWIRKDLLHVDKSIANSPDLICSACQFGKVHKCSRAVDTGHIVANHTAPGKGDSVDQLEAGYPGKLPTACGLHTPRHYKYVSKWVDHYSHYIFLTFSTRLKNCKKLCPLKLPSKAAFEAFEACHHINLQSIWVDNGVHASQGFQADCWKKCQKLMFCIVGGHWQNRPVKRYIGHITHTTQTILLHALSKWPGTIT